ncbi:OmpA family protein [Lutibacter sp.]
MGVFNLKKKQRIELKYRFLFVVLLLHFMFGGNIIAQSYQLVTVTGVFSGNETDDTLFKATSSTIPSLAYIRAQRISGPQDGVFTQSGDNIRYTAISKITGIPGNLSKIRFSFLQSDKRSLIPPNNFRFVINDIDGPNNEALATNCSANVRFVGTANPTNLKIDNTPPDLNAVGTVDENEGATSRVMFEFKDISIVEFDNYANDGYLKDFDLDDDYPIATPLFVECLTNFIDHIDIENKEYQKINFSMEFKNINGKLIINTNPIYFDRDEYNIREDAVIELEKVLKIMNKYPEIIIELQSHTDSRASDDYNIELSENRAKASVDWIINKGIDPARITGKGFGETQLVNKCSNGVKCNEAEHQLNRRTEFIVLNPEVIKQ